MRLARLIAVGILMLLIAGCGPDVVEPSALPAKKQTTLGLYVTARTAYAMWQADPDRVHILDVRTPGEYIFNGHALMARNVPIKFLRYEWNAAASKPVMKLNPDFVSQVQQHYDLDATLLVHCRGGKRAAAAVNALAAAGFTQAYTIVDGFEGDIPVDADCSCHVAKSAAGWKHSGAPWTYQLNPKLMYLTE